MASKWKIDFQNNGMAQTCTAEIASDLPKILRTGKIPDSRWNSLRFGILRLREAAREFEN